MSTQPEPALERLLRLAGFVLGLPGEQVALVTPDRALLLAQYEFALPELQDSSSRDGVALHCARVAAASDPLVLSDLGPPPHAGSADAPRPRFFIGLPLRDCDGRTLAVLYATDDSPRQVAAEQLAMLRLLLEQLGEQLELRRDLIRLRAEGAERERERATLLAMLDQSPAMISFWNVDETNVYANELHRDYFGVTSAQIKGRPIRELLGSRYDLNQIRRQKALAGVPQRFEYALSTASGARRDIDISYVPFFYQGAVTGLIVLATDVTQRNQAAVSLARSEATQRALLAALPGIYLRLSPGGRVTALFGRTSEILGISSGEEIEQRWRDLNLSPEFSQLFSRIEDIDWSCGGVYEVHALEQKVQLRGEIHHIEARVAWPPGTADRVCLLLDVTRRVEAEAQLASSQSLLAAVTTHAPIGIIVLDAQDQVLFANAKAKDLAALSGLELTRNELDKYTCYDASGRLLPPSELPHREFRRNGVPILGRIFGFDTLRGDRRWVEIGVKEFPDQPGQVMIIACDVTDRRIQEQALRDYSAHLDALIDAAPDCMLTTDVHGNITQANAMIERLLGYSPVEVLGQNVRMFTPQVVQRQHDQYVAAYPQLDERIMRNREVVALRKDGSTVNVEVSVSRFLLSGTTHYLAVIHDVSERQINRARSEFVAMVSHELRAPLHAVMGMAEVLMEDCSELNPQQRKYLSTIRDGARHLNALVSDILDLSRIELGTLRLDCAPVSAQRLCDLCTAMVSDAAQRKRVQLKNRHRKKDLLLNVDARRINQILLNLLDNAIKFTPSGGSVELSVQHSRAGIEFRVKDTGIGISKRDSERLFMPFSQVDSSTQRKYQGTGIGLYLSRRLAILHGGNLNFRKPARCGSVFVLTLPVSLLVAKRAQ